MTTDLIIMVCEESQEARAFSLRNSGKFYFPIVSIKTCIQTAGGQPHFSHFQISETQSVFLLKEREKRT